ncbi:MAG TPA: Holliday junction branch migration protein RuvA [Clostridiales bacterium UBA9857]|jgi:Holliday junction DNA helicase RuvA|nr:Holliday junction branch migration protein RuvA [Candidatus Fermentithermobacillaceae bacterium]HAF66755.1 Holliday junction branch migration protein RuvA [Clostridiales bacterium UBA9857]HPT35226.1 Holliday junction branch migration protein RuvA [Bacillota bacterium]
MISLLNGKLVSKGKDSITVLVGGVGLEVTVPSGVLTAFETGQKIQLYTRLIVRDDSLQLYGFKNLEERALFDMLMTVQGIGPRIAVGILSSLPVMEFYKAVLSQDEKTLTKLPGIGKKTAGRIIVELRDKIGLPKHRHTTDTRADMMSEATEALMALGYSRQEAHDALSRAIRSFDGSDLEALLREALKYLARF